jgi:hypothetical protein
VWGWAILDPVQAEAVKFEKAIAPDEALVVKKVNICHDTLQIRIS